MNLTDKSPVINSLLDTDFYKFTMAQLIFRSYGGIRVEFSLIDRSHAPLARFIDEGELRGELNHIRTLCFNNTDLHYLRGTNEYGERMFGEDFLKNLELPSYTLERKGESYDLSFEGPWPAVMLWEIPALASGLFCILSDISPHAEAAGFLPASASLFNRKKILSLVKAFAGLDMSLAAFDSGLSAEAVREHFSAKKMSSRYQDVYLKLSDKCKKR